VASEARIIKRIASRMATIAEMDAGFQCAGCGEWDETTVDESSGGRQKYVEDCQVCCRPNVLRVGYDSDLEEFLIRADLE
jgi:Cysteine-rich CPXCG